MNHVDTREWLLSNGLGSFASGTVSDARTRTYHGWLIAALNPPSSRTLLLSHLDASLEIGSKVIALSTNFWEGGTIVPTGYKLLQSFAISPVPTWIWGENNWQLTRQMVMPNGRRHQTNETLLHRILIQYQLSGSEVAVLRLRLMIGDRDFHHQQQAQPDLQFLQSFGQQHIFLQAISSKWMGTPWQLRWTQGEYQADEYWYWNYCLPEETKRGLGDREDLYSPGYLTVTLQPGASVTIEATTQLNVETPLNPSQFEQAVQQEQQRLTKLFAHLPSTEDSLWQQLLKAGDQFIVHRSSIAGPTVIAGYPWFNDWGRDTLIALPGLALTTQRYELAKGLLQTFGSYCRYGLIPNAFPDTDAEPFYNSIDASLWWIETLGLYLEATHDWTFLAEQYPVVQQIYKAFTSGTKYNIQVDASDGLVSWDATGVALTWMDALVGGQPVTPRRGKPVEINALWYSALCWASDWAERLSQDTQGAEQERLSKRAGLFAEQAQQVKASLQKFWNPTAGYLYDTIDLNDYPNDQIRPNAVLALSLHHCAFGARQGRRILQQAKYSLLTPYGLRSLAPTDPEYVGKYAGNSPYRDRAYHQGTVWTWLIGPFIRAWQRFYDYNVEPVPFDWQPLLDHFQHQACIGSVSEIFDGDPPHSPQGAIAQAWSVAEIIRHYR